MNDDREINRDMLAEAREDKNADMNAVAAILTTPDGKEHIVMWTSEYGDGEYARMIQDLVEEIMMQDLLLPGELIAAVAMHLVRSKVN